MYKMLIQKNADSKNEDGNLSEKMPIQADSLCLGLDTFALVDDSAAECSEVSANIPSVAVVQLPRDSASYPVGGSVGKICPRFPPFSHHLHIAGSRLHHAWCCGCTCQVV
jgi:hypothetical protein